MCQNGVHDSLFAKVPYLDCVVVASSCYLVTIWQEAHGYDLSYVGRELENVLAASQVPNKACAV